MTDTKHTLTTTMLVVFGAFAVWLAIGFWWGHWVAAPQPHGGTDPAVTVVTLANGQAVTCITVGGVPSCDWAGFRSDPNYKAAKP